MQPQDLILKRECHGERIEYVLYLYDGTNVLKRVDGPWPDEAAAKRLSIEKWRSVGTIYYNSAPNTFVAIGGPERPSTSWV